MDVGHQRDGRLGDESAHCRGSVGIGYGDPHDRGSRRGQSPDLTQGRVNVVGTRVRHRLDDDGRTAADANAA